MKTLLVVAGAGAAGSVARHLAGVAVQRVSGAGFPFGTLAVNVAGSLLIGLLAGHFMNDETRPLLKVALMVGFCGGFTTFSAFSLETFALMSSGAYAKAVGYVGASVALCLLATAAGYAIASAR
jgi:CrcB protein